jgi:hypothetical protein
MAAEIMTKTRTAPVCHIREDRKKVLSKKLLQLYFLALLLITAPFFVPALQQTSLKSLAFIALITILILFAIVLHLTEQRIWSASSVYLIVFCVFHFGAVIPLALNATPSHELQLSLTRWFDRTYTHTATLLALLGLVTYVVGVHIASLPYKRKNQIVDPNEEYISPILTGLSFVLLLSGIVVWFVVIFLSGGIELIFGSYRDYLDVAALPFIGYTSFAYFAISLGFPLLISNPASRLKTNGMIIFAIWAVIAIPLGLRGEALFPLAAAAVMAAKQRSFSMPVVRSLLVAIVLLSLISAVRQLRQVGLREYDALAELRTSPVDALIEMGSSLRPVTEVLVWETAGEGYIMGSSYWAPVERAFRRVLPGVPRTSAEQDERLMNVLVQQRVGPIGFSPVAEAYRNFGYIGVGLFMFLIGFMMGRLDRWPTNPVRNAYLAVIFVPFLIQIRNDFTPIPFQLMAGFLIVQFAVILGKAQLEKSADRPNLKKRVLHNR